MRSDVIGDLQEPYRAVLVDWDDIAALPSNHLRKRRGLGAGGPRWRQFAGRTDPITRTAQINRGFGETCRRRLGTPYDAEHSRPVRRTHRTSVRKKTAAPLRNFDSACDRYGSILSNSTRLRCSRHVRFAPIAPKFTRPNDPTRRDGRRQARRVPMRADCRLAQAADLYLTVCYCPRNPGNA